MKLKALITAISLPLTSQAPRGFIVEQVRGLQGKQKRFV
jgi:hypothetical protein